MRVSHLLLLSAVATLTTACKAEEETPPATCALEAAPTAGIVGGDSNGDGHFDVSDGTHLARANLASGPAPACEAAVDLLPNGYRELGDIPAVFLTLGPKSATYVPTVSADDCPAIERSVTPPCGDGLALSIDAPAEVTGSTPFTATVEVTAPIPVEAWSFTLTASGCALDSGTTAGTTAADQADGTGGLRVEGVAWQSVTAAEAQVLTVLDWRRQGTLPTGTSAIHSFSVSGTPTTECVSCTLTLTRGDPSGVESIVAVEGWRYDPALGSASIQVCPA